LSHEKDLPLLFSAFERLEGERRGAYRLKIVGDGPLRPLAEKFAREHDNAEYCGLCPYGAHLAEHYRTSDVVALPSPNETFGLAILEALASGVPVVAARRGGPAGLLSAGLGGLSEPGNAADMAAKIEQAIHHRHQGSQYRDYVVRHFSWSRTFDRLLQLYGELLEARRATSRTRCRTPVDSA
jgi:glycosyltransferase involved in cell wall biosynthesis